MYIERCMYNMYNIYFEYFKEIVTHKGKGPIPGSLSATFPEPVGIQDVGCILLSSVR